MNTAHEDFYRNLRKKVKRWARTDKAKRSRWIEYVLAAPDLFYLLCRLAIDKDVPLQHKAKLAIGIAYFVSPIDLIPDPIPLIGLLDDIAVAAYVLNGMFSALDPEIIRRHWAGEGDVLALIQKIVKTADDMIGKGLWRKIKRFVNKK